MSHSPRSAPDDACAPAAIPVSDPLVRRLFVGLGLSALGSGLTLPFLFVYLAEVRDIPTSTVGLLFAWMGVLGFAVSPLGGSAIDRFGPRSVMLVGLCTEALGVGSLVLVQDTLQALLAASLLCLGGTALWPASTAMLTRLVPEARREKVYGLQFMLLNAGLGIGGLVSAALVHLDDPASFQRVYVIDACSYLGYILIVATLPRGTGRHEPRAVGDPQVTAPGWRVVLADRALLRVVAASVVVITFGYAQLEAGFSAYAVDVAHIPARLLGLAYGANTAAIVLGQLVALRLAKGRRRSLMLAACAAIWSVSWGVVALSGLVSGALAVVCVVVGLALFGMGETLWAPLAPALVNGLATEELRGRYNALQGMSWTVGSIIGPALAGLLIGNGLPQVWVACTVGGTAVGSLLFASMRRHLTPGQDRPAPVEVELAA